jgi:hypothetical protein
MSSDRSRSFAFADKTFGSAAVCFTTFVIWRSASRLRYCHAIYSTPISISFSPTPVTLGIAQQNEAQLDPAHRICHPLPARGLDCFVQINTADERAHRGYDFTNGLI